ncbi:helix-turn-helix domain-containing protein [Spirillospora sp. CA-253888]
MARVGQPLVRRRELAKRLRELRDSHRLSLMDVAAESGCSPSKVSRIENAQRDGWQSIAEEWEAAFRDRATMRRPPVAGPYVQYRSGNGSVRAGWADVSSEAAGAGEQPRNPRARFTRPGSRHGHRDPGGRAQEVVRAAGHLGGRELHDPRR